MTVDFDKLTNKTVTTSTNKSRYMVLIRILKRKFREINVIMIQWPTEGTTGIIVDNTVCRHQNVLWVIRTFMGQFNVSTKHWLSTITPCDTIIAFHMTDSVPQYAREGHNYHSGNLPWHNAPVDDTYHNDFPTMVWMEHYRVRSKNLD